MDEIIKNIETQIQQCEESSTDPDEVSWGYEEGVLLSVNEAKKILKALRSTEAASGMTLAIFNEFVSRRNEKL